MLFIQSDQLACRAVGYNGLPWPRTPNLDRLAHQGVAFTQAIAPAPFCSPSRASWLTGLYPHRHGITYNVGGDRAPLAESHPLLCNLLHSAGWLTLHRGKWHLGDRNVLGCYREDPEPGAEGADRQSPEQWPVHCVPAVQRAQRTLDARGPQAMIIGRTEQPPERMEDSLTADAIIALLGQAAATNRRFFATCSLRMPHPPYLVPDPYYSLHERDAIELPPCAHPHYEADSPARRIGRALGEQGLREYAATYHGMVSFVDWNVGRLLDALDRLGLAKRTLVVFTSDHGDMMAAHGMAGKLVLNLYEELIHVPLLMRLPGRISAGARRQTPVSSVDIMPTILDYADLAIPPGIDGRSMRSLIDGEEEPGRAVFSERFGRIPVRAARTSRYRYTWFGDGRPAELYDLDADPYELRNAGAEPALRDIKADLHARLRAWMARTGDPALELMV